MGLMPSVADMLPLLDTLEYRIGFEMEAAGLAKPTIDATLPPEQRADALLAIVAEVQKARLPPPLKSLCKTIEKHAKALLKAAAKEAKT